MISVMTVSDPFASNREAWDERAPAHAASVEYGFERFASDPTFLSGVVRFDRPRLGDITGLRAVHLQCHIGTDTVSLARLGARVTGLDFSPASIAEARRLATLAGTDTDFVQADVHDAVVALGEPGQFDLVYTGVGALCWLPSVARWAQVVADLLRPGGRLFIREAHPVLWAIDETVTAHPTLGYPYFEHAEPFVAETADTYVTVDHPLAMRTFSSWNHGLGEIISAVIGAGMRLTALEEHQSVAWEALPGQMVQDAGGEWRLADRPERLPASYTLQAVREP